MDQLNASMCRVCFKIENGNTSLFPPNDLKRKYEFVWQAKLTQDNIPTMPQTLCQSCIPDLLSACEFIKRINLSEHRIKEYHRKQLNIFDTTLPGISADDLEVADTKVNLNIKKVIMEAMDEENDDKTQLNGVNNDPLNLKQNHYDYPMRSDTLDATIPCVSADDPEVSKMKTNLNIKLEVIQPMENDGKIQLNNNKNESPRTNHNKNESNQNKYVCPTCSKSYKYERGFKFHYKFHELNVGHKQYECYLCHVRFSQETSLCAHMRSNLCGRVLRRRLCFQKGANKPCNVHECNICENQYKSKQYFRKHYKKHST